MTVIQQYCQLRKRHTQTRRAALVACMGKWETYTELQLAKTTEERQLLGDLRINWKIILKCIFKTYGVTEWVLDPHVLKTGQRTFSFHKIDIFRNSTDKINLSFFVKLRLAHIWALLLHAATSPVNPLKTKYKVSCLYSSSSSPYRAVNTLPLGYTNQSVNAV
jgi:hypothetical protein